MFCCGKNVVFQKMCWYVFSLLVFVTKCDIVKQEFFMRIERTRKKRFQIEKTEGSKKEKEGSKKGSGSQQRNVVEKTFL